MSSIDNRIVQMQFENSQFEKGVNESLKSLDNLKKGLELKEGAKSLDALQKAGNSFSLLKIADSIDAVSRRFSALGIVGMRVIQNLTDSAYRMGVSFLKSVSVDQITSGFSKYAQKTKAVQQIVNSTGLSIGEVNDQLDKLNWFTDETSYSFVDMVSNIGKFTSMNIPLDKSVTAMQGISTWAALSGAGIQEANRAMYNLSQAIGLGSVKMQDWKSIALANMATAEFKQQAIDTAVAMGKLRKGAVDVNNFESTLSKGWFTSDVLIAVLEKYGDFATQAYELATREGISAAEAMDRLSDGTKSLGERAFRAAQEAKTFQEAIESVKDAVSSSWMRIFENIFGNYEEAKTLWTDLANGLWDVFASPLSDTADLFSEWHDAENGRAAALEGIYDIFHAIYGIILSIQEAFSDIFPPLTLDRLTAASEAIREFGSNFRSTFLWGEYNHRYLEEEIEEVDESVKQLITDLNFGDKGEEVKKFQKQLADLGYDVGDIDGIYGKKTKAAYDKYLKDRKDFRKELKKGDKNDDVKELQEKLIEAKLLDEGQADGIFGPKTEAALKKYQEAKGITASGILDEDTRKLMFGEGGLKGKVVNETLTFFGNNLKRLQTIAKGVFAVFDIGFRIIKFAIQAIGKVLGILSPVVKMFGKIFEAVSKFFIALDNRIKNSKRFQKWLSDLEKFLSPIKDKISQLCQSFLDLIGLGGDLEDIDFDKLADSFIGWVKKILGIDVDPSTIVDGINSKSIIESIKNKVVEIYTSIRDWIAKLLGGNEALSDNKALNLDGYKIVVAALSTIVGLLSVKFLSVVNNVIKITKDARKAMKYVKQFLAQTKNKQTFKNVDQLATAFLKFAGAVAIMAASVYALSTLSWEKMAVGLTALIVILGVLIGSIYLLNRYSDKLKNAEKLFGSLVPFGQALISMATVVLMLSNLSVEALIKGLLGITVLLGIIVGFLKLLSKIKIDEKSMKSTIGIISSLALSLSFFADIVNKLGAQSVETLIKGFAGLAAILFAIKLFLNSIKDIKITGATSASILALAAAIDLLIGGFIVLLFAMKLMKPVDIIKGIVGLAAVGLALVGLLKVLNKINPSPKAILSLLPMAIALDLVIAGFVAMVLVMKIAKPGDIVKGLLGISALMLGMVGLLKLIEKIHPNIGAVLSLLPVALALTLAVGGFVALVIVMKRATPSDIVKALVGIGVIVLSIAGLMKLIEKIKPNLKAVLSLIPIALALDLAIIGLVVLAMAMKHVDTETLVKTIIGLVAIIIAMISVTKALAKLSGGVKGSISVLIASVAMIGAIAAFAIALNAIKDIPIKKIVAFAAGLSAIMIGFGAFAGISAFIGIGGIVKAGAGLIILTGVIVGIAAALSALLSSKRVAKFFKKGAAELGEIIGTFTGSMKAADMKAFSKGMEGFKDISEADEHSVTNAIKCAQLFADFANGLPEKGFFKKFGDFIIGSDIEYFSNDMESFAKGFNSFAKEMEKVEIKKDLSKKTKAALDIATNLKKFQDGLPSVDSYEKIIAYSSGLSPMAAFMADSNVFAASFNALAAEIMKIDIPDGFEKKVKKSTGSLMPLKEFAQGLPEPDTWPELVARLIGMSPMQQFNSESLKFVKGFDEFQRAMMEIPDVDKNLKSKTSTAVEIFTIIQNFNANLPSYSSFDRINQWLNLNVWSDMQMFMYSDVHTFADGLNGFVTSMRRVTNEDLSDLKKKTDNAVSILKLIASFATDDVPQYSFLEKSYGLISGLISERTNLQIFASADVPAVFKAIVSFKDGMKNVNFGDKGENSSLLQKAESAVAILKVISTFVTSDVPEYNSAGIRIFGGWLENRTDLEVFANNDIPAFIYSIKLFEKGFKDVTLGDSEDPSSLTTKVEAAVGMMKAVASFAKYNLPEYTELDKDKIRSWFHRTDLEVFSEDSSTFVKSINDFTATMKKVSLVDENGNDLGQSTTKAVSIMTTVANFLNRISRMKIDKESGALKGLFSDDTSQKTVFDAVTKLADTLVASSLQFKIIGALDFASDVEEAIGIMESLATFLSEIADEDKYKIADPNGALGYMTNNFTNLMGSLDKIANKIAEFNSTTSNIESPTNFVDSVNAFINFANLLSGQGEVKISTDDFLGDLDATAVSQKLTEFTTSLSTSLGDSTKTITEQSTSFNDAGSSLINAVSTGMGGGIDTSALTTSVSNAAKDIQGYAKDFVTSGKYLATGLAMGITFNAYLARNAAALMARKVIEQVNKMFQVASPSKVFMEIGKYNDEGLANGMTKYGGLVTKAAEGVGESTMKTAKGTMSNLSSILAEDIDDTPVVRPVVDLSNARAAASTIGGMFQNQSFAVESSGLAAKAAASSMTRAARIQNGSGSGSGSSVDNSTQSSLNLTGNNFYVRSEQDIHSLASELATLSLQQQRSYGAVR